MGNGTLVAMVSGGAGIFGIPEKINSFSFWLDHIRLAGVRFMDGGPGSFISLDGLFLNIFHPKTGNDVR